MLAAHRPAPLNGYLRDPRQAGAAGCAFMSAFFIVRALSTTHLVPSSRPSSSGMGRSYACRTAPKRPTPKSLKAWRTYHAGPPQHTLVEPLRMLHMQNRCGARKRKALLFHLLTKCSEDIVEVALLAGVVEQPADNDVVRTRPHPSLMVRF
jgi:hypothetical protein